MRTIIPCEKNRQKCEPRDTFGEAKIAEIFHVWTCESVTGTGTGY